MKVLSKELVGTLVRRLDERWKKFIENAEVPKDFELEFFKDRVGNYQSVMISPHKKNWQDALSELKPDDVLFDAGCLDLRFAIQASLIVKKVYAVDMNPRVLSYALDEIGFHMPRNIVVVCADWQDFPLPDDVTVIMCLVNGINMLPGEWFDYYLSRRRRVYLGEVCGDESKVEQIW